MSRMEQLGVNDDNMITLTRLKIGFLPVIITRASQIVRLDLFSDAKPLNGFHERLK